MNSPFPIGLMWLTVLAYGIAQIIMLARTSESLRLAAGVPMLLMVPCIGLTAFAFDMGSPLAPMLLLLMSPLSCLYFFALTTITTRRHHGLR